MKVNLFQFSKPNVISNLSSTNTDMIHTSAHYRKLSSDTLNVLISSKPFYSVDSRKLNEQSNTNIYKNLSFHTHSGWDSAQPWGTKCFFSCNHNLALGSTTTATPRAFLSFLFLACLCLYRISAASLFFTPLSFYTSYLQFFFIQTLFVPSRHKHYRRLLWSVSWQALISSVRIMLLLSLSPSPYLSFVSFSLLFPSPYLSFASCSIPFPCPYLSIASFSILSAVPTLSFLVVPAFQSKLQLLCFPPFLNLPNRSVNRDPLCGGTSV